MMHSIRAILIKPFTKPFIKAGAKLICISLLLITQTAHADFRKALDAYIARDGATMLKEVKDAVGKKNDDGLILFISTTDIDYTTSRMSSFEPEPKPQKLDLTKIKSTWETILTEAQQKKMFDLLNVATLKARVEARYKFIHSAIYSKYKLEINNQLGLDGELAILAKKGSASAAYELYQTSVDEVNLYKWLLIAANNGSANAAYEVAMFCYSRERGAKLLTLAECKIRNEEKMFYWLKRALQNQHGGAYWVRGRVAAELSKLYLKGFEQQPADAKEAYLWALIAINNDGGGIFNDSILGEIHKKGLLKQVDPVLGAQLEDSWNDKYKRRELVQIKQIPVLPKLLKDLAKANNENPVFSFHSTAKLRLPKYKRFYFSIGAHDVDIYADGRVNLNFGYMDSRKENVETVLKLTPQQLQQFITDVKSLKMADWVNEPEFCADDWCGINVLQYFVLNRVNDDVKTFEMSLVTPKDITPTNLEGKYFSQITTLIEKYIPTQKLRCSIGTSKTYTQSCLDFYYQLAKTGE